MEPSECSGSPSSSAPLRFSLKQNVAGCVGSFILRLLWQTLRCHEVGLRDDDSRHWASGDPIILVCWHGQQLLMPWIYLTERNRKTRKQLFSIVSASSDGRIAASLLHKLSIQSVAGSSSRGGARALGEMRRHLQRGSHVAVTPDGPRGPVQVAKEGAVKLASLTGCVIVPAAFACERKWVMGSWDSMIIPKPFSKSVLLMGAGIRVAKALNREEVSSQTRGLTAALLELNVHAEERLQRD